MLPEGTAVYVANRGDDTVSVIDAFSHAVTETVSVGTQPIALGQFIGGRVPVGGSVTGLVPTKILCVNRTGREVVRVDAEGGLTSWNCEDAGLEVEPGDTVRMIVRGSVNIGSQTESEPGEETDENDEDDEDRD